MCEGDNQQFPSNSFGALNFDSLAKKERQIHIFCDLISALKKVQNKKINEDSIYMSRPISKNTSQPTLLTLLSNKSKPASSEKMDTVEKKSEDSPKQLRKSSRIQQQRVIQEQQTIQPEKKQTSKVNSKQKGNGASSVNHQQTTLNYMRKESQHLEVPKIQSQSMSQEVSSIQSTIPSPSISLPKQDHQQFQKIISELNYDQIVQQLEQFSSFISSLLENITQYIKEQRKDNLLKQDTFQKLITKIEKQIRFILFRFITTSPFSVWNNIYCPQRVSQLIEEINGQLIQLWIRKYYKGIKDKQKGEQLFGYVDSDDDFTEYFDQNESNMSEDYANLLNSQTCKNWKNKGNILILSGQEGCGKSTALKAAIKSLKMQIIEISNSTKRSGADLKKINEITQSCRLDNAKQGNDKQQPQKNTIASFFNKKKTQSSQEQDDKNDQINIDAKDSSKKVIYFRNFDIEQDTSFQNEVLKLSENSKVPFILSIKSGEEQDLKSMSLLYKDMIDFQRMTNEQITILLYIIYEVEKNFRQYHFLSPLYVGCLVNEERSESEMISCESPPLTKEQILLQSEEFKSFMASFPSNNKGEGRQLETIHKIVNIFKGDFNTCLSFIQSNMNMISETSDLSAISQTLNYIQMRDLKLNNLTQVSLSNIPLSKISPHFQYNVENYYQIFLNSNQAELSDIQLKGDESESSQQQTDELSEYLMNIENLSTLDVLNVTDSLQKRLVSQYQNIKQWLIFQGKLEKTERLEIEFCKESIDNFYSPQKRCDLRVIMYETSALKMDIDSELKDLDNNLNKNQQNEDLSQLMIDSPPDNSQFVVVSNFLQNKLTETFQQLQVRIFLDLYKSYDMLSDKVDKSDKVYLRKSQFLQYFQLIPVLDTIKTTFMVGSKRTRSQQTKASKDIINNPQSIVEQTINKNLYDQFKLILNQFNLKKENSFSQNLVKSNSNLLSISNSLNGLSLQSQPCSQQNESLIESKQNIDIIPSSEDIKINNQPDENENIKEQSQNTLEQQNDKQPIELNPQKSASKQKSNSNHKPSKRDMEVEVETQSSQGLIDKFFIKQSRTFLVDQENINPNNKPTTEEKELKQFNDKAKDMQDLSISQTQITQQV